MRATTEQMSQGFFHRVGWWFVPSLSQCLWLVLLWVLLAQPWRTMMVASDGDAYMHWRVGDWMLEHKQIIHHDEFSHTRDGAPIISKEWASELLFATAGRGGGLFGLSALAALVIATTFALLHRRLVRDSNDLLVATGVTLLAVWAASMHWLARPHVFSFLLLLLWHECVQRLDRGTQPRLMVAAMGLLMALWVNIHGGFLAGFLVLGAYWLGAVGDAAKLRRLSIAALLCAGAVLLNPSGYKLPLHNLMFLRSEFLVNWLAEYSSMNFQSREARGFLAWLALLFLTLAWRRPRLSRAESLLLISWTWFALYSRRNIPLMVILTAPIIVPVLSEAVTERWRAVSERLRDCQQKARGWPVVGALAWVIVVCVPHPTELPADRWPVAAVRHIQQHPDEFTGRMFNNYVWGGYLLKVLPAHRVFVDGRTDFYGEALIRDYNAATTLQTNWLAVLESHDVRWTLTPRKSCLNQALAELPNWRCTYTDEVAAIYRRNP